VQNNSRNDILNILKTYQSSIEAIYVDGTVSSVMLYLSHLIIFYFDLFHYYFYIPRNSRVSSQNSERVPKPKNKNIDSGIM